MCHPEIQIIQNNLSPHELVQNTLHPHVHAEEVKTISPEQTEEIHDEPVTLFKGKLLPIKDGHLGGNILSLRNPCKKYLIGRAHV